MLPCVCLLIPGLSQLTYCSGVLEANSTLKKKITSDLHQIKGVCGYLKFYKWGLHFSDEVSMAYFLVLRGDLCYTSSLLSCYPVL